MVAFDADCTKGSPAGLVDKNQLIAGAAMPARDGFVRRFNQFGRRQHATMRRSFGRHHSVRGHIGGCFGRNARLV